VRAQLHPGADRFAALLRADGELPLAALVAACTEEDVQLAVVPDEVLLLCGQDATAAPRPHWSPWLLRDDVDADVARATSVRWLRARGLIAEAGDHDADRLVFHQPLATLSWALASATGVVTYDTELRDGTRELGGVFVLPDGLVLHDHIDLELGLHRLVFRLAATEVAWLAAFVDPAGASRRTQPPITAASLADLDPHVRALPGRGRSRAVLAATTSAGEGRYVEHAVTAIGTSRGLWLIQGRVDSDPGATLQQVGEDDVIAVAERFLGLR
jgi:hypothetical protein